MERVGWYGVRCLIRFVEGIDQYYEESVTVWRAVSFDEAIGKALPAEVRNGPLPERLLRLLEEPWDGVPERPHQSEVRHAFFGDGDQGMLTFIVHEQSESLRIIDIL